MKSLKEIEMKGLDKFIKKEIKRFSDKKFKKERSTYLKGDGSENDTTPKPLITNA